VHVEASTSGLPVCAPWFDSAAGNELSRTEVFEQADIRWKRRQGGLSNGLILKDEASGLIVIFQTNDVTLPFRHTA
jgi:hypothetical protein